MDQKLIKYLTKLREEAEASCRGVASEIPEILSEVSMLTVDMSYDEREAAFAVAAIFDEEFGVLSFIKFITSSDKASRKARESCFAFLAKFINRIGRRALPYGSVVKAKCLYFFKKEDSKAVQAAMLSPLISILEISLQEDVSLGFTLDWSCVEWLLEEYRKSKTNGTLRAQILVLVGYAIEMFHHSFEEDQVNIVKKLCLESLEEQLHQTGKVPVFVLVAGAMRCLDSLLTFNDKEHLEGGAIEDSRKIYSYLEQVIYFREDLRRYEMVKAGLRLLSRHATYLLVQLLDHCLTILNWLQSYCIHPNAQLREVAYPAIDQFLLEVVKCLLSGNCHVKNPNKIFKMIFTNALVVLDNTESDPRLKGLAILILGKLSPLIMKFSGKECLSQVFYRLIPFGKINRENRTGEESLKFSVTLVGAFSEMVVYFDCIENYMVSLIVEAVGNIFYSYPFLFPKQREGAYSSLQKIFKALYSQEAVFTVLVNNIVWSSLERAIEPVVDEDISRPLWKDYVELWSKLLILFKESGAGPNRIDTDREIEEPSKASNERNAVELQAQVFDCLMKFIIKAMKELNVKYVIRSVKSMEFQVVSELESDAVDNEGVGDLIEPLDPLQMRKYLNLVEFVQGLLYCDISNLFLKWVYPFGRCLIELSTHYPLVSGFYKLLATCIKIAEEKGYFIDSNSEVVKKVANHVLEDAVLQHERDACSDLFRKYLLEVLVGCRCYKLELLVSCLRLCLSAPTTMMNIMFLVGPIITALKIGLRHFPLAMVAMDCLEKWHESHPESLEPLLHQIVPHFNNFLVYNEKKILGRPSSYYLSMSSDGKRKSRMFLQRKAVSEEKDIIAKEVQLGSFEDVQMRIQRFLGRLGGKCHQLVQGVNLFETDCVGGRTWDTMKRVKFTIPFSNVKPDIWLDTLLMRIIDVSTTSSNRSVKVAACELLHAILLVMVGNAAKGPARRRGDEQNVHYEKIYRHLFPAIFCLATDVDLVTRQLFSVFVKQLIHWFTSNTQKENPESMALLDAILDGIVDPENGSLREFCAECFAEYMQWSIRHTPIEVDNVVNVVSLLRRLYARLDHPNPYHRLGATMAAHLIYPILRENSSVVDLHIFELLFFCVKCLRIGESDDPQTGTIKLMSKVLAGLQRLVKRNINSLQKYRKHRKMFSTLQEFLDWLFTKTGQEEENCRVKCMWLFISICEMLPVSSAASWFKNKFTSSERVGDVLKYFGMKMQFPEPMADDYDIQLLEKWMRTFVCSVHWFDWATQQQLISLDDIITNVERKNLNHFAVTADFIHKICNESMYLDILTGLTPAKKEAHSILRIKTLLAILHFLKGLLHNELGVEHEGENLLSHIREHNAKECTLVHKLLPFSEPVFVNLLCQILFYPLKLAITVQEVDIMDNLLNLSVDLIALLSSASPSFDALCMQMLTNTTPAKIRDLELAQPNDLEGKDFYELQHILKSFQKLNLSGMLMPALGKENAYHSAQMLLMSLVSIGKKLPPGLQTVASDNLMLSLNLGVTASQLLEVVMGIQPCNSGSDSLTDVSTGNCFYFNYRNVILQQLKFSYHECLPIIIKEAVHNYSARLLLNALLDDYLRCESITKSSFLEEFLRNIHLLKPSCKPEASLSYKLYFLETLQKLFALDSNCQIVCASKSLTSIIETYFSLLDSKHLVTIRKASELLETSALMTLKSSALVLVPYFLKFVDRSIQTRLVKTIANVVSDHLLVEESDIPQGSNERSAYFQMLARLQHAVLGGNHLELLEVVFPLLNSHVEMTRRKVQETLEAYAGVVGNCRDDACAFGLRILDDSDKNPTLRRSVLKHMLIPMLINAPSDFLIHWYENHIVHFKQLLCRSPANIERTAEKEEDYLTLKISYYKLVEILFTLVDATLIKDRITPLASNQELIQTAINDSRAKNDPPVYLFMESLSLWREMHIAAYNCLAWIVMRTQDQEKVYLFLFKDFPGRPLWQHIVDCSKIYDNLPVESSMLKSSIGNLKSIQQAKTKQSKDIGAFQSLSLEYAVGATLSEEPATINTFVSHPQRANAEASDALNDWNRSESSQEIALNEVQIESNDKFDDDEPDPDDFDLHPSMTVILQLIEHCQHKFASKHSPEGMPDWMKAIYDVLDNSLTPLNVCLFISKVVTKARKIFASFSASWFRPYVQTILRDPDHSGGRRFHNMLRDICITIIEWNLPQPPDKSVASTFVNHLISVSPYTSNLVIQANLEILGAYLKAWKDFISLDYETIIKYLTAGGKNLDESNKFAVIERCVALQLLVLMASAHIPLCKSSGGFVFSEEDLCKILLSNLSCKFKDVYEAASEVIGIVMRLSEDEKLNINERILHLPLKQYLLSIFKEGELVRFLGIIDKITMGYPPFLDSYVFMLIEVLAQVHGALRLTALDIILRKPNLISHVYNMVCPFLSKLLSHRDEAAQLKSLKLVSELVKEMDLPLLKDKFLPLLFEAFSTHENEDCRQLYYNILIVLYKERGLHDYKVLRHHLLVGLNDSSDVIRHNLQEFWHSELSRDISQRFVEMIHYAYDPDIEECWTQIADVLLLKLCEDSVDFDRPVFNAPLSECEFYEYTINTAWLGGTLPLTPLFSETQSSSQELAGSLTHPKSLEGGNNTKGKHVIRATYLPTPSLTVSQSFRIGDSTTFISQDVREGQSSLEFEGGSIVDSHTKLKRRIPKSGDYKSQSRSMVLNALRRRQSHLAQQTVERANKVQLMRQYRTGEIPDIEIAHKDVIIPLSVLAEKDAIFARLLLLVICQAVHSLPSNELQKGEKESNLSLREGIERALQRTKSHGSFVGCAFELCLETKGTCIEPKLVGAVAQKSKSFHTGILLLETVLFRETFEDKMHEVRGKRHCGSNRRSNETDFLGEAWLELVKLYRSIGESDIVLSIYKNKLAKTEITVQALESQLQGETSKALLLYDDAITQLDGTDSGAGASITQIEQDILYNQRLQCLIDLNQWHDIMEDTMCQLKDDMSEEPELGKLWSSTIQDPYLGLFIKGAAKLTTYSTMLSSFVHQNIEDPTKREILLSEFSPELATLAVITDQHDLATFYIKSSYETFRKQWSGIHPLAIASKHLLLRQLQRIVELDEFVKVAREGTGIHLDKLVLEWQRRWPSPEFDNVEAWDDIVQNRLLYFQKFQGLLRKQAQESPEDFMRQMIGNLESEKANVLFESARGLMLQGSYDAAQGYMNQYMAELEGSSKKNNLDINYVKSIVKLRCLQANRELNMNSSEAMKMLQQVQDYVTSLARKPSYRSEPNCKASLKLLEGNVTSQLAMVSLKALSGDCISSHEVANCVSLFSSAYKAYSSLFTEISSTDQFGKKTVFTTGKLAKIYLKFAFFCDEVLSSGSHGNCFQELQAKLREGVPSVGLPHSSVYPALVVKYILKAVKLDSSIKYQHGIARVLTLLNHYPDTHSEFVRQLNGVPCSLFIAWIPQILAVIDKEEGAVLVSVLEDIANLYPQALYFPFNVSRLDFGPVGQQRTEKIEVLLRNPFLEGFTYALQDLIFPEQRLDYWISNIKNFVSMGNHKAAEAAFEQMFKDCLDVKAMSNEIRKSGKYNIKFAQNYSKKILKAFGEHGCKLKGMDEKTFSESIKDVLENLGKSQKNLQSGKINLSSLSKWMAEFDGSGEIMKNGSVSSIQSLSEDQGEFTKAAIEMPGSYSRYKQPDPCSHVRLLSFDQSLICLSSKQRPKILKMRGSDENDYKFLVKGGEDLRLDQRIEQLFEVMNSILSRNPACAKRDLFLRTYTVIPVSKQCGIIEFVEDTRVIKDVIEDGVVSVLPSKGRSPLKQEKSTPSVLLSHLRSEYQEWVQKRGGSSVKLSASYTNMYHKVKSDEVRQKMNALISQVPWDALKMGISKLATSAESFLALRSKFVRSLAALSICGYIAGVGDRHLSNFLIDVKNGMLVPIDFGYSFGAGVILLPVPELIPFRLTPQFTNVLLPLDSTGLLRNDMICTLSALHSNREILSAVLDVFTNEPLVDWRNEAMKISSIRKIDPLEGSAASQSCHISSQEERHVALKIETAHRKLNFWNPAEIIISELHSSIHANKPYLKYLEEIVCGSPEHNIRARIKRRVCHSIQEQVDCLIDQATDPNLLGRIWVGWQPWL